MTTVSRTCSRTDGVGVDRVSVAAPAKPAQQAALQMASKRAVVVYFAGLPKHDPVSPLDMNELHYKELSVRGAYGPRTGSTGSRWTTWPASKMSSRRWSPSVAAREDRRSVRDDPSGTGLKMVVMP